MRASRSAQASAPHVRNMTVVSEQRRRDVQGLRAIAVLLVVAFHAGLPASGGFVGVDVFFVISGFVITGTLLRELSRENRIDLPAFYARRVRRLLPALALMLTTVALAGTLLDPAGAGHISALTGIYASAFSANFYLYSLPNGYFSVSTQLDPLLHTWTLAVEEQFYLVFPVLLFGGWWVGTRLQRQRTGRLLAVGVVAVVTVASFVAATAWSTGFPVGNVKSPLTFAFYASPARAWEFGLGALVSLAGPLAARIVRPVRSLLVAAGLAGIAVPALLPQALPSEGLARMTPLLVATVGTSLILLAGTAGGTGLSRLLGGRALVEIGDLSYSWYLWHWPIIVFAAALLPGSEAAAPFAALLSLLPAWASYTYVESPVRTASRVKGRVLVALALLCVGLPVAASAGLAAVQGILPSASASALHADWFRGCNTVAPFGARSSRQRCTWTTPKPRGSIVLIGDSNAGHFTEPVVAAARRLHFDVRVATLSDCPFVHLRVFGRLTHGCSRFNRDSLTALIQRRPALVIVAARSDLYLNVSSTALAPMEGGPRTRDPAAKLDLWTRGLREEAAALNRARIPVVVVHPIPALPVDAQSCAVVLLLADGCRASMPRRIADGRLRPIVEAEERAVAGLPAAWTLDVENLLCPHESCSSRRAGGGLILYANENHLTVAGALTLTQDFYRAIAVATRASRKGLVSDVVFAQGSRWRASPTSARPRPQTESSSGFRDA